MPCPALFLYRDGVINVDHGYVVTHDRFQFMDGIFDLARAAVDQGYRVAVITNQSGIARGYFDMATLGRIHDRLRDLLADYGVTLDGIYLCPHGPDDDCACRKPLPGMVEQAVAELKFDPAQAFLIGDKGVDIELARAVGATGILVRTGHGAKSESDGRAPSGTPIFDDLTAAVHFIEQKIQGKTS